MHLEKHSEDLEQKRGHKERRTISEKNEGDASPNLQLSRLNCKPCRFKENQTEYRHVEQSTDSQGAHLSTTPHLINR